MDNKYGSYSTVNEAKSACLLDSNCQGVYDRFCVQNEIYLCPVGIAYSTDTSSSCIYERGGGKFCNSLTQTVFCNNKLKRI